MAVDTREVQVAGVYGDGAWRIKSVPFDVAQLHIDGWLFVSPGGDDESATGTIARPYATLKKALASITDASPTKRYTVWVSGPLTEAEPVTVPPNVFLVGTSPAQTRVQAPEWWLSDGWTGDADNRGGFVNIGIGGNVNAYWESAQASAAKLYITGSWLLNDVQVRSYSATNQTIIAGSRFFGAVFQASGAFESSASVFEGDVSMDANAADVPFRFRSSADAFLSSLALTKYTAAESTAELYNSYTQQVDLVGMACKATAQPLAANLSNGARFELVTAAASGGAASRRWTTGTGDPNGVVFGEAGDLYTSVSGGAAATLWVKESDASSNGGWVAK